MATPKLVLIEWEDADGTVMAPDETMAFISNLP